jgi:4-cresol dehydrogenase (hydroxylating)
MEPALQELSLEKALQEFRDVLGISAVLSISAQYNTYGDDYALSQSDEKRVLAVLMPQVSGEVQSIMRIAARHGIPLWPVSRGRNLGYGGSQPLHPRSIIVDLGRMNRILQVDERCGYCELEPGVSFFDLFDYLRTNKIALWPSIPGHAWGSVLGNALERGLGYMPYGDHAAKLCGLEVVLPDGEIVRTGMGSMSNSRCWHHYQGGFGPSWDQMFVQSNLGVVTRAGVWLMPEPEATLKARINPRKFDDLRWVIDLLAELRLREVIEHPVTVGNYIHEAAAFSRRSEWYRERGALPERVAQSIMAQRKTGHWNLSLMLFGFPEVISAQAGVVRRLLRNCVADDIEFHSWKRGEPLEHSAAAVPGSEGLKVAKWHGGTGAHINFSPVLPPDGALALEHAHRVRQRFEEFGLDYCASFTVGQRHIQNINTLLFDRSDAAMIDRTAALYRTLIADAARAGLPEYRTHIDFMQEVARTFDYNNHALLRLNERVKDAIDPAGILAPGKNGVWPRSYRNRQ